MRIFGLDISVRRLRKKAAQALSSVGSWFKIFDTTPGAWQRDEAPADVSTVSGNWAVFGCVTLIAGDIAKMPARVMRFNALTKIWDPTLQRPVLKKPNHFQTRIDFFKCWVFSLLLQGNTYVLKERDENGFIVALYILDPCRVTPLVATDGSGAVFYQLASDNLSGIDETVTVPASEIIHDRLHTLWHPLIGVSPIYACAVAAAQGSAIQKNSEKFFKNMSRPSGILTAPGAISGDTAKRLKEKWDENFGGDNIGKTAVLGDGLKYEAMTISAVDSQLIEQLKFTGEMICAVFHVPPYKLGLGPMPTANNTGTLNQQYYDQCLQPITENMELRLDDGLELGFPFETWMDESVLLRMDPATRLDSHNKAVGGGWLAPNEARREENRAPMPGGDTPYLQQQNYSLAALDRRDTAEGVGTQVTALQGLIAAAAKGDIPVDTVRAAIAAAFPLLTPEQIDAMCKPLDDFEPPAPPEPAPTNEPQPSGDDPAGEGGDDEEESDEDEAKRVLIELSKDLEDADYAQAA
jgi:HK97 family phage portal protein